ncbi:ABC transporter permease [Agromyces archimandritae]|uniref:ABC transporter permease n=1 Tax=Agromyces archimandritae TaxID=2781962 RepID=A0A975FLH4_9MICO|nr:ABC transporter permease [Agromyces archimandritae]QTX04680.1 ABC transporter permease [Agromyces archimandritae]
MTALAVPTGSGGLRARRGRLGLRVLARAGGAVFVLWAVVTITFFAVRLVPGDPALAILGGPGSQAGPEALALVRAEHGLDRPLGEQYLAALVRLAGGDLGTSYALRMPVGDVIAAQLGGTLLLAVLALAAGWAIALGLALFSTQGGRFAAAVGGAIETVAAALPQFWLAAVLIALFSTGLGWLPPVSTGTAAGLVLPVLTLAIPVAGFLAQVMRTSLLDALASPFALSARARGESGLGVRIRHGIRHAAVAGVDLSAWAFGYLVSGAVVVETVFARPGLGRSLVQAVTGRDVPLVTGIVIVVALAYILITILADAVSLVLDPRLRSEPAG